MAALPSAFLNIALLSLLLYSRSVYSHHSPSPSQALNETSNTAGYLDNYLRFAILIIAAVLQQKQGIFWNEARIPRKLKSRHPRAIRNNVVPEVLSNPQNPDPYEVFFYLYIGYSKGRHRKYSRMYAVCYYYFSFAIPILGYFVSPEIYKSDAILALSLPIYAGSLSVIGASGIELKEIVIFILMASCTTACTMLLGLGHISLSHTTTDILAILYIVILGIFLLSSVVGFWSIASKSSTAISGIVGNMWRVERENFTEVPRGGRESIRSKLSTLQEYRLDEVSRIAKRTLEPPQGVEESQASQVPLAQNVGIIQRLLHLKEYGDLFSFWILITLSSLILVEQGSSTLASIVLMDLMKLVGALMIFINNTRVEEELFDKLMKIAHM